MEVSQIQRRRQCEVSKPLNNLRRRHRRLQRKAEALEDALKAAHERLQLTGKAMRQMEHTIACQQAQVDSLKQSTEHTPERHFLDPNVYGHSFAASMVALCVNLATIMPLRTISKALEVTLSALGIQASIPDRETITRWCKRLGLDRITQNQNSPRLKNRPDMIWIVDHSNQIGTQKVLVILGISAEALPSDGQTLALDQVEVLAIEPGESWKRDDVREVYRKLASQVGRPRWVLCDGAVELRESVDVLCDQEHTTDVLRDFKHFAANRFESLIGRSDDFTNFLGAMGKTRCLLQQSELAHLTPPGLKTKARFMNIEPIIAWAQMALAVLDNPQEPESGVQDLHKLEQRLGWLRDYREQIASWKRCCDIIALSLRWINTHGLRRETAEQIRSSLALERASHCDLSDQMLDVLLEFLECSSAGLKPGQRTWISSEVLESAFGLFKRREGQQSRGGFTGLIISLPTLLQRWTVAEVRESLRRTTLKAVNDWTATALGATLWSRRAVAFRKFGATKCPKL